MVIFKITFTFVIVVFLGVGQVARGLFSECLMAELRTENRLRKSLFHMLIYERRPQFKMTGDQFNLARRIH